MIWGNVPFVFVFFSFCDFPSSGRTGLPTWSPKGQMWDHGVSSQHWPGRKCLSKYFEVCQGPHIQPVNMYGDQCPRLSYYSKCNSGPIFPLYHTTSNFIRLRLPVRQNKIFQTRRWLYIVQSGYHWRGLKWRSLVITARTLFVMVLATLLCVVLWVLDR